MTGSQLAHVLTFWRPMLWHLKLQTCQIFVRNWSQCLLKMCHFELQNVYKAENVFVALKTSEEVLLSIYQFKHLCSACHFSVWAIWKTVNVALQRMAAVFLLLCPLFSLKQILDHMNQNVILSNCVLYLCFEKCEKCVAYCKWEEEEEVLWQGKTPDFESQYTVTRVVGVMETIQQRCICCLASSTGRQNEFLWFYRLNRDIWMDLRGHYWT